MNNHYSISEVIVNVYSLVWTKIFMPQCRMIRRPAYIRGRKSISGAKRLTTGYYCRFDLEGGRDTLFIGDDCQFGDMTHIVAIKSVTIGHQVLIASKVFISDTSHGNYTGDMQSVPSEAPTKRKLISKSINIGNNVWIGDNVVVLAGASIGNGCIIGANSVITKSIPDNCIVVGVNRIIKKYNNGSKKWEEYTG